MLNITRLHNAISAVSFFRRVLNVAIDYAFRREAFGKILIEHKLHKMSLIKQELILRGNLLFIFEVSSLLNKIELKNAEIKEIQLY